MSPILQAFIALTVRILLRLLLLRKMSLTIRNHLSHMIDIVLLILALVFLRILLEYCNNLATGIVPDGFAASVIFRPACADGLFAAEPVLKLFRAHVDEFIKLSETFVIQANYGVPFILDELTQ